MGITASVTNNPITASVTETKVDVSGVGSSAIDVTVAGGVGPTGAQGPAGESATLPVGTEGHVLTYVSGSWTAAAPASGYTLPTASSTVLGGVKIGSGITITDGVISASSGYTLPTASAGTLGGVKIGSGVTITDGVISVSTDYAASTHAGQHAAGGADELFDQSLNTTDSPTFDGLYITDNEFVTNAPATFNNSADFSAATVFGLSYNDLDDLPPTYAVRSDTVSNVSYIGRAVSGSATSASVWTIRRTTVAAVGTVTVATATNVKWDDRTTASYS